MIELANWTKIGARIEARRKELGITKKVMSEYLDVSPYTYNQMEKGKREFSVRDMQGVCLLFHISPEYFLTGEMGLLECRNLFRNVQDVPQEIRKVSLDVAEYLYVREKKRNEEKQQDKEPT